MRGTPLLLQLIYIYYVLPEIGIRLDTFTASVLGLTLNYSAYISEVYRSGIQAIGRGQSDAAAALGMTRPLALRRIVLPQAIRIVIPALGNFFISLFKDTALCSVVSVQEVLFTAQVIAARNFQYFTLYTMVGVFYFAVSFPTARFVDYLERRTQAATPAAHESGQSATGRRADDRGPRTCTNPSASMRGAARRQPDRAPSARWSASSARPAPASRRCCAASTGSRCPSAAASGSTAPSPIATAMRRCGTGSHAPRTIAAVRAKIGMVFQSFNLFPHMTALENVIEAPMHVLGLSKAEATERAPSAAAPGRPRRPGRPLPGRSSPAASSSASPSRARWRWSRRSMLFDEVTSRARPGARRRGARTSCATSPSAA